MIAALQWTRRRLSGRPDSEHGQVLVRAVITALFSVYLGWQVGAGGGERLFSTWLILLAELVVSLGLLAAILVDPGVSHVRRWIGMLADYAAMASVMYLMGETASPLYAVYLWVTIGNGLRYGPRYLYFAIGLASGSFLAVILATPYWKANPYLSWGLQVGLAAVPLYFASLLKALTRAIADAQSANEAKSRFLANMSHEFRTPLNGLAGTSELLATTRLDSEQKEYLGTIQASTRSLLALVEDVLDISAIEAGKLKLDTQDFSLPGLVEQVGLILLPAARAKQIEYQVHIDPAVPAMLHGDPVHLHQVLVNLISNAIKFTEKGHVRLVVAPVQRQNASIARLRFTVSDTGIGIPAAARARLFDAFEQADSSISRRHGGTGLGTTIAKGLTEAMGGTIGFESMEHAGSRFWVELPFRPVARDTQETGATPASGRSQATLAESENVIAFSDPFLRHRARVRTMRVLIADDHAANRMVLQSLLQKAGHRVVAVEEGEAVLDALEASDYDAVIADLHMPGISGLDLLRQLRVMEAGTTTRTPVVILSADVTPESIQRCEQAGAHAFVAKPVVASRLLDILADIASGATTAASPVHSARADASSADNSVLDPRVLEELTSLGMGKAFETTFIAQCISDAEQCLHKFEGFGADEQWDQIREQAHALKGVASNLGLVRVVSASGEVMRLSEWQLSREWRRRLQDLQNCVTQGREALAARGAYDPAHASEQEGSV